MSDRGTTPGPIAPAGHGFGRDDRALSSVVGKALELGVLALYVGLLVSTFYGGAVPEYRASAGGAVADRTTAAVATDVETSVPATDDAVVDVSVERSIEVPASIRGTEYSLELEDGALVLDHPDDRFSREVALSLPDAVVRVEGDARSAQTVVVVVESTPSGLVVRLEGR